MAFYGFKSEVLTRLDKIIAQQEALLAQGVKEMATLEDVVAKVAQETTDIGSLKVFMQGLKDQIAAIPGVTPAMQAQIDAVFAAVSANDKAVVDAMAANVPPTP